MWVRALRDWTGIAALGILYFITGRLGLMLEPQSGFATLIWPPTGIALAALLLFGYRYWPGIAAGAFLLNLYVGINKFYADVQVVAAPWLTAGGVATANTLEPLL